MSKNVSIRFQGNEFYYTLCGENYKTKKDL